MPRSGLAKGRACPGTLFKHVGLGRRKGIGRRR